MHSSPKATEGNPFHQPLNFRNFCGRMQIMTALICSFKIQPGCVVPGAMLSAGHSEVPKANGSLIPTAYN